MDNDLEPGELVVAKGKLARVQQVFSTSAIRVLVNSTGAVMMLPRRDIEKIESEIRF